MQDDSGDPASPSRAHEQSPQAVSALRVSPAIASMVDLQALSFLRRVGPHEIGILDSEEKLAAALLFVDLQQRGLVISEIGNNGPIHRITPAGLEALRQGHEEGGRE